MLKYYFLSLLIPALLLLTIPLSAATFTWNGSVSNVWGNASNWTLTSGTTTTGIPASTDDVVITTKPFAPLLPTDITIAAFTISSGSINLGGHTLTITANATIQKGTITNGQLVVNSGTTHTTYFGVTTERLTIGNDVIVKVTTGVIYVLNTTFMGEVHLTKTGGYQWSGYPTGGNIFNGATFITNQGTYSIIFQSNTFNGVLTVKAISQYTYINSPTLINNDIVIDLKGGVVAFEGTTGLTELAEGKKILLASTSGINGSLRIQRFHQKGSTPQTLDLVGSNVLALGPNTTFDGDVDFKASSLLLKGTTFKGKAHLEKRGSNGPEQNTGGNVYHGLAFITNAANAPFTLAVSLPDVFYQDVTFTNSGSGDGSMLIASSSTGNTFKGNIYLNANATNGGGISFGYYGGTCILEEDRVIKEGSMGISNTILHIKGFTQLGSTKQQLSLVNNAALRLGSGTVFQGPVNLSSPRLYLDGATFHQEASFTKTGSGIDNSYGNNTFKGKIFINNQATGSSPLNLATSIPDQIAY